MLHLSCLVILIIAQIISINGGSLIDEMKRINALNLEPGLPRSGRIDSPSPLRNDASRRSGAASTSNHGRERIEALVSPRSRGAIASASGSREMKPISDLKPKRAAKKKGKGTGNGSNQKASSSTTQNSGFILDFIHASSTIFPIPQVNVAFPLGNVDEGTPEYTPDEVAHAYKVMQNYLTNAYLQGLIPIGHPLFHSNSYGKGYGKGLKGKGK